MEKNTKTLGFKEMLDPENIKAQEKKPDTPKVEEKIDKESGLLIEQISVDLIDIDPENVAGLHEDEPDFIELGNDIRDYGIREPITLTKQEDGRYKVVAGHRRLHFQKLNDRKTIPSVVKNLTPLEAKRERLKSNLKRNFKPLARMKNYVQLMEVKYEELKQQGRLAELGKGSEQGRKLKELLEIETGESYKTIERYVKLQDLVPELQELVDDGTLKITTANSLANLKKPEQRAVEQYMAINGDKKPNNTQLREIIQASEDKTLTPNKINEIMSKSDTGKTRESTIDLSDVPPEYFRKAITTNERKERIVLALKSLFEKEEQQKVVGANTKSVVPAEKQADSSSPKKEESKVSILPSSDVKKDKPKITQQSR